MMRPEFQEFFSDIRQRLFGLLAQDAKPSISGAQVDEDIGRLFPVDGMINKSRNQRFEDADRITFASQ